MYAFVENFNLPVTFNLLYRNRGMFSDTQIEEN